MKIALEAPFAVSSLLVTMTDLDHVWEQMLEAALQRAEVSASTDVSDFLRLKASNDAIRNAGVGWLFDAFIAAALSSERPAFAVERVEPFRFARGRSTMAGSMLRISFGVRCIEVRAGWTRTPSDGIMRDQALAAADIVHLGLGRENAELSLLRRDPLPEWFDAKGRVLDKNAINGHLDVLTRV